MIDEMQELRKANPHRPHDLAGQVAMARDDLLDAIRADTSRFPALANWIAHHRLTAVPARAAWTGVLAAMVLTVLGLGQFGVIGGDDTGGEVEMNVADGDSPAISSNPDSLTGEPPTTSASATRPESTTTTASSSAPATSTVPASAVPASVVPTTTTASGNETANDETAGDEPANPSTTSAAPAGTAPPSTTAPATAPEPVTTTPSPTSVAGPLAPEDLLVVHLDFAHTDDGLAALATRELAIHFGLQPFVVAGTAPTGAFAHPYDEVMTASWGSQWIDAGANRSVAVDQAAAVWRAVLDSGGDIWVAEGGVSDFSAEVLRRVQSSRPSLDTATRIHVVQHAQRNENATALHELAAVRAGADYLRIDDGNSANGTADLREASSEFEAAALTGPRAAAWQIGFDEHDDQLDFSDAVTVLHILGIGVDQVAHPDDFATLFL